MQKNKTMSKDAIKPFLCLSMDQAIIRIEWEKWKRAFDICAEANEITNYKKLRTLLLHLGGVELQEIYFNLPDANVAYDEKENNNVLEVALVKLDEYFTPKRISSVERSLFREMKLNDEENINQFMVRLRQQTAKCNFGSSAEESLQINLKDKIIDCCKSLELKKRLLEKEFFLNEVIVMCHVHEQVNNQARLSNLELNATGVNKIKINNTRSDKTTFRPKRDVVDAMITYPQVLIVQLEIKLAKLAILEDILQINIGPENEKQIIH
jgi:hypothetical protein